LFYCQFLRFFRTIFFKNGLPSYLYIVKRGLLLGREGHFVQVRNHALCLVLVHDSLAQTGVLSRSFAGAFVGARLTAREVYNQGEDRRR
jgi:hypothetical protein